MQGNGLAVRIHDMRIALRTKLEEMGDSNSGHRNWQHMTKQIGMFAYTGMTKDKGQSAPYEGEASYLLHG